MIIIDNVKSACEICITRFPMHIIYSDGKKILYVCEDCLANLEQTIRKYNTGVAEAKK